MDHPRIINHFKLFLQPIVYQSDGYLSQCNSSINALPFFLSAAYIIDLRPVVNSTE